MNTNFSDNEKEALSRFFRIYFYGDFLDNPADLNEALDDYLNSEEDQDGLILRAGVSKLLSGDYSEEDTTKLVEKEWKSDGNAKAFGYTYKDVLSQLASALSK
jgi:hypothetical protein